MQLRTLWVHQGTALLALLLQGSLVLQKAVAAQTPNHEKVNPACFIAHVTCPPEEQYQVWRDGAWLRMDRFMNGHYIAMAIMGPDLPPGGLSLTKGVHAVALSLTLCCYTFWRAADKEGLDNILKKYHVSPTAKPTLTNFVKAAAKEEADLIKDWQGAMARDYPWLVPHFCSAKELATFGHLTGQERVGGSECLVYTQQITADGIIRQTQRWVRKSDHLLMKYLFSTIPGPHSASPPFPPTGWQYDSIQFVSHISPKVFKFPKGMPIWVPKSLQWIKLPPELVRKSYSGQSFEAEFGFVVDSPNNAATRLVAP